VALGPLGKVKWKRVVADEGHVLKNPKAKSASRWGSCEEGHRSQNIQLTFSDTWICKLGR
jgi:hypothetical protein